MKNFTSTRLSRTGMYLVGGYAFLTVLAVIAALQANDNKGSFVLLSLPVVLQGALIVELMPMSLLMQLTKVPWVVNYLMIWLPTALFLYAVGWRIDYRFSYFE